MNKICILVAVLLFTQISEGRSKRKWSSHRHSRTKYYHAPSTGKLRDNVYNMLMSYYPAGHSTASGLSYRNTEPTLALQHEETIPFLTPVRISTKDDSDAGRNFLVTDHGPFVKDSRKSKYTGNTIYRMADISLFGRDYFHMKGPGVIEVFIRPLGKPLTMAAAKTYIKQLMKDPNAVPEGYQPYSWVVTCPWYYDAATPEWLKQSNEAIAKALEPEVPPMEPEKVVQKVSKKSTISKKEITQKKVSSTHKTTFKQTKRDVRKNTTFSGHKKIITRSKDIRKHAFKMFSQRALR